MNLKTKFANFFFQKKTKQNQRLNKKKQLNRSENLHAMYET